MQIKQIIIEGDEGDLAIRRTTRGAAVCAHDVEIEVDRNDSREDRYIAAWNAAKVIYGTSKKDEPMATNSMVHPICVLSSRRIGDDYRSRSL